MKFLVVSDTHGQINKVVEIYKNLSSIDAIIHCGDYYKDALKLNKSLGAKVFATYGNCDGSFNENDYTLVETECGNILVTHGHMQKVDYNKENLMYFAESKGCIGAVFGHTHVAMHVDMDDFFLMNPGSLTNPRDGSSGSYGIITTSPQGVTGQIIYVGNKKKKPSGGRLRNLLNFSDRF